MDKDRLNEFARPYAAEDDYSVESLLTYHWYAARITERMPHGTLLELGIGPGVTTRLFAKHYNDYDVVEGSSEVIRQFKEKGSEKITVIESLFETFETDKEYDLIVMGFILEHVDDPLFLLKHYSRFLQPDGRLYVTVPNALSLHRRIGHEAGMLPDLYTLSDYDRSVGHQRYFDLEKIEAMVQEAGYRVTLSEGIYLKPFGSAQIAQLKLAPEVETAMMAVGRSYPELANSILIEAERVK